MFTVHHSNRLEVLADQLAALVRQPTNSLFVPETIIVQSLGMARWLSFRLADHLGVCAHVRFPFPAAFIWDMFHRVLPHVPETSPFAPDVLTWHLMALLGSLEESPRFASLSAYCEGGDDVKRYALASRIATVYDQYLVYRPDWIRAWETGTEDHWQAELWRRVIAGNGAHRLHVHEQFLRALETETWARAKLPGRVSLIGIPAMPPMYLDLFAPLAESIDLHLFLLNPCQEYWGDIVADRDLGRQTPADDPEALHFETGNPLLASMGKLGRDFIDLVHDYPHHLVEQYADPGEDSLLHCLQSDVLHLRNPGAPPCPATPLRPNDHSVQVHVCHSRMREIEVLYDQLLGLFETDPELQPSDVVVMAPEIDAYAPLIEAVFGAGEGIRRVPFSIADRGLRAESPVVNAFFALLDLPSSRYDVNRVLALLEVPAIQRRFALTSVDLALVRRWLQATGVRWGIDHDSRAALGLPAIREHTWRAGLDRLLAGYALRGGHSRLFQEILPYDAVEGVEAQVVGRLHTFTEAVFGLTTVLRDRRPVRAWIPTLMTLLEGFFAPDETDELDIQAIRQALSQIGEDAAQAGFDEPVSLEVLMSSLRGLVEMPRWPGRFLTGGITFCALVPMRSIPFEVVCLIGMHDEAFPRTPRALSFDLMAQAFRRGDRSRRHDDRYLFLEALLSARRYFYVSYVGRHIRENSIIPPSVLVSELLDTVDRGFYLAEQPTGDVRKHVVIEHPLQPFSRRYFTGDPKLFSFAADLCEAGRMAGRGQTRPAPLVTSGLPEPGEAGQSVEVRELLAFFRHPVRYFLQRRLGIYLDEAEGLLATREPFTLEPLLRYQLLQEVLQRHLTGEPPDRILSLVRAAGLLPHGQVGVTLFEREWPAVEAFVTRLEPFLAANPPVTVEVDLPVGDRHVIGHLDHVRPQGLLGYRLGKTRGRHYLEVWLRHLMLNCLAPEGVACTSHWLAEDIAFTLPPLGDAQTSLQHLLTWYWQGLCQPLHFYPESALAYAQASRQQGRDPLAAARQTWESSDHHRGEDADAYYQLTFRENDPLDHEFTQVSEAVFGPLLAVVPEGSWAH
jgi:exodeoxyribonuclease V gamma subunit